MLEIAPNSRPSYAVEFAARGMAAVAGALPFAQAIKGKVSEDEEVEEQFLGAFCLLSSCPHFALDGKERRLISDLPCRLPSTFLPTTSRPANLPRQAPHRNRSRRPQGPPLPLPSLLPTTDPPLSFKGNHIHRPSPSLPLPPLPPLPRHRRPRHLPLRFREALERRGERGQGA